MGCTYGCRDAVGIIEMKLAHESSVDQKVTIDRVVFKRFAHMQTAHNLWYLSPDFKDLQGNTSYPVSTEVFMRLQMMVAMPEIFICVSIVIIYTYVYLINDFNVEVFISLNCIDDVHHGFFSNTAKNSVCTI